MARTTTKKPSAKKPTPRKSPAKKPSASKAAPKAAARTTAKAAPKETAPRRATIVGQILGAYKNLRASFEAQMSAGYGEERLLAYVALACLLAFVASIPAAMRTGAFLENGEMLPGIIAGRFVAMVLFGPLFLYGIAALSHVVAVWTFGGQSDYFRARIAFFWALLLGVPLILFQSLALHALELSGNGAMRGAITTPIGLIWLWVWSTGIAVAEGFERIKTFLLLITVVLVIFGITLLLSA